MISSSAISITRSRHACMLTNALLISSLKSEARIILERSSSQCVARPASGGSMSQMRHSEWTRQIKLHLADALQKCVIGRVRVSNALSNEVIYWDIFACNIARMSYAPWREWADSGGSGMTKWIRCSFCLDDDVFYEELRCFLCLWDGNAKFDRSVESRQRWELIEEVDIIRFAKKTILKQSRIGL